jgi:hypothetical protein
MKDTYSREYSRVVRYAGIGLETPKASVFYPSKSGGNVFHYGVDRDRGQMTWSSPENGGSFESAEAAKSQYPSVLHAAEMHPSQRIFPGGSISPQHRQMLGIDDEPAISETVPDEQYEDEANEPSNYDLTRGDSQDDNYDEQENYGEEYNRHIAL